MEDLMRELKMTIFDRGAVTEKEVALMRSFVAREGLNECTARMLLDINNVLSGEHHESFDELYMGALLAFLLGDGAVISQEKWLWLRENLLKDGIVDALERRLLETLCREMTEIPAEMREFAAAHAAA